MHAVLQARFLGIFGLAYEDAASSTTSPAIISSPRLQSFLAYLLLQGQRRHSRSVLAGVFNPDMTESRARHAVSQAIWQLRRSLAGLIETDRESVWLVPSAPVWVDALEFDVFSTDGLRLYFYALTAHFGHWSAPAGSQGYRILCSFQDGYQVAFVPAGAQTLAFNAGFSGFFLAQQVQGQMAQDRKVGIGIALAHPTGIFTHGHVQHPMEAVFDFPVTTARRQHLAGVTRQTADVVTRFDSDLVADPPLGPDLRHAAQAFPRPALPEIAHELGIRNRPTLAALDPAMPFGNGARVIMLQVSKLNAVCPLIEGLDIFGQPLLVLLERQ